MYSEYDVSRQVSQIENGYGTPIGKARRLLRLSRGIKRFAHKMEHGCAIIDADGEDEAHVRLQQTLTGLNRLSDETREAAARHLNPSGMAVVSELTIASA